MSCLASVAAAGCLHRGDFSADEFERYVSIEDVDSLPDEVPLEVDIEVTRETANVEGKPVLLLSVTNEDDVEHDVETPFYKGRPEHFLAGGRNRGVLVYSRMAADAGEPADCIVAEDPRPTVENHAWTDEDPVSWTLAPGETGEDELLVVDDPTRWGCYPSGRYRFEGSQEFDGEHYSWGFTLLVEQDG